VSNSALTSIGSGVRRQGVPLNSQHKQVGGEPHRGMSRKHHTILSRRFGRPSAGLFSSQSLYPCWTAGVTAGLARASPRLTNTPISLLTPAGGKYGGT
jgi:hypothetical protein